MANFLLLYTGGAAPTPADRDKVMQQWGGWFGKPPLSWPRAARCC